LEAHELQSVDTPLQLRQRPIPAQERRQRAGAVAGVWWRVVRGFESDAERAARAEVKIGGCRHVLAMARRGPSTEVTCILARDYG
jgi:hypothetical protein